VTVKTF